MDHLTTYSKAKAADKVAVAKLNDSYVLSMKQFDPNTGEPKAPQVQAVDKALVQARIDALQAQIDALNALLDDLNALDAVVVGVGPATLKNDG